MKFTLKSFADGLTEVNRPLNAGGKTTMRMEVRRMFPSADRVLFNNENVTIVGRLEVLRYFIERRTPAGRLRKF